MFNGEKWLFDNALAWIELCVIFVLLFITVFFILSIVKRKAVVYSFISLAVIVFGTWFFGLKTAALIAFGIFAIVAIVVGVINQASFRPMASNSLAGQFHIGGGRQTVEKVFDRHAMYTKVCIAVDSLSKTKTGAIITFERNTKLDDYIKSGTILNSPVTPELLMTIFYPGTRLHDGAVVIRRDQILAASVYYTPTTKPLVGKFGSRHRAAIGISEVTDSVTIVVSEETGRISLAINGELIPVPQDKILRTFEEYMTQEEHKVEEQQ